MKKTADGTLQSGNFTKRLLGFDSAEEWLRITDDFGIKALNGKFHDSIWSISSVVEFCEALLQRLKVKSGVVDTELDTLNISDEKATWIKNFNLRCFKVDAEKLGYTIQHLEQLLSWVKRLETEMKQIRSAFENTSKMSNDYLYRLCELRDKIED